MEPQKMNIGYMVFDENPKEYDSFCDKIAKEYIEVNKKPDNTEIYQKSQKIETGKKEFRHYFL
jgi:hypothetical protein